jgi:hypothetical protein
MFAATARRSFSRALERCLRMTMASLRRPATAGDASAISIPIHDMISEGATGGGPGWDLKKARTREVRRRSELADLVSSREAYISCCNSSWNEVIARHLFCSAFPEASTETPMFAAARVAACWRDAALRWVFSPAVGVGFVEGGVGTGAGAAGIREGGLSAGVGLLRGRGVWTGPLAAIRAERREPDCPEACGMGYLVGERGWPAR